MGLKRKILELHKKREEVLKGGGDKAIEKQTAMGKMTARERVISICDPDSFHEYDLFVEHEARDFDMAKKILHGDGVIIGTGTIYGAPVCLFAQDFTVAGGSLGLMHARKITKIMDHALKMKVPLIGINDSGWSQDTGRCKFTGRLWRDIFQKYTFFRCYTPDIGYSRSMCRWSSIFSCT
jgi:methylmalonyl-CoA decarboxylase subunit alpha